LYTGSTVVIVIQMEGVMDERVRGWETGELLTVGWVGG
jgi:hypothetical protein